MMRGWLTFAGNVVLGAGGFAIAAAVARGAAPPSAIVVFGFGALGFEAARDGLWQGRDG